MITEEEKVKRKRRLVTTKTLIIGKWRTGKTGLKRERKKYREYPKSEMKED